MEKTLIKLFSSLLVISLSFLSFGCYATKYEAKFTNNEENKGYLAIVIDDFGGYSRKGVDDMLGLDIPITCAIMPNLPYSEKDAIFAHSKGKEVILHMPMEANCDIPQKWYGEEYIKNSDNEMIAKEKIIKALETVPYVVGMNYHIGSGVCQNEKLIKSCMEVAKSKNLYFLDSYTHIKTVCKKVAKDVKIPFAIRDDFLEKTGVKDINYAKSMLKKACDNAKKYGYYVVIGHVGEEGGDCTLMAIKESVEYIKSCGVTLCFLSKIVKKI